MPPAPLRPRRRGSSPEGSDTTKPGERFYRRLTGFEGRDSDVEAVQVGDLGPGGDEVVDNLPAASSCQSQTSAGAHQLQLEPKIRSARLPVHLASPGAVGGTT